MRYRPATTVPGRKRPSSTVEVALRWGTLVAPVPNTTVSAEVESSGAAQDEQKRLFSTHSRVHAGHRIIRFDNHLSAPERGEAGEVPGGRDIEVTGLRKYRPVERILA
jgi:hypothetical protein